MTAPAAPRKRGGRGPASGALVLALGILGLPAWMIGSAAWQRFGTTTLTCMHAGAGSCAIVFDGIGGPKTRALSFTEAGGLYRATRGGYRSAPESFLVASVGNATVDIGRNQLPEQIDAEIAAVHTFLADPAAPPLALTCSERGVVGGVVFAFIAILFGGLALLISGAAIEDILQRRD